MEKRLVIISACRFTREALITLLPADRYVIRTFRQLSDNRVPLKRQPAVFLGKSSGHIRRAIQNKGSLSLSGVATIFILVHGVIHIKVATELTVVNINASTALINMVSDIFLGSIFTT